jgi:hypothetical protein
MDDKLMTNTRKFPHTIHAIAAFIADLQAKE